MGGAVAVLFPPGWVPPLAGRLAWPELPGRGVWLCCPAAGRVLPLLGAAGAGDLLADVLARCFEPDRECAAMRVAEVLPNPAPALVRLAVVCARCAYHRRIAAVTTAHR